MKQELSLTLDGKAFWPLPDENGMGLPLNSSISDLDWGVDMNADPYRWVDGRKSNWKDCSMAGLG